jgi:hypothetical protein
MVMVAGGLDAVAVVDGECVEDGLQPLIWPVGLERLGLLSVATR